MGNGCSRVQDARRNFTQSVTNLKSRENGKDAPSKQESLEESHGEGKELDEDEDEDLDALSPISAITKVGSGRTRGMSAASTVLPGTSISLSPAMEELSELQSYKPLPELTEFSEETRNLLLGRCPAQSLSETPPLAEIPFLVLCNGDDAYGFFEEVQKVVMPILRELCYGGDATLNVYVFGHQSIPCGSDFRHLIVHFARDLLKAHRLVTMTIFGRSSVQLQPPDIILQSDFDAAVARMQSAEYRELIHCMYAADVNAVKPCYRLSQRARKADDWPRRKEKIMRVLEVALEEGDKDVYLTSVFEDILCTLLDSSDQYSRERSFLIHLEHSAHVDERPKREDARVQHLLSTWEDIIPEEHRFSFFDGDSWQELDSRSEVRNEDGTATFGGLQIKLRQLFERLLEEFEEDSVAKHDIDLQLREELIHQQNEIQHHLKSFQDRPELLSSLMNYIAGPQNHPLVVHGRQGRGKSALLAVATVLSGAVFPVMPVLFRSACVSPESFTQEQILRSVCEQLSVLYGEHPSLASRSIAEHNSYFSNLLRRARAERPLVIILDGLDQVEEYSGRSLKWFPVVLPQHVKLILGLRDGTSELQELQERLLGEKSVFLEVRDMEIEETLSVIRNQMRAMGRRLTENQINFVRICVTDNAYPRYAHVFARVACTWNSLSVPDHFWSRHSMSDIFGDYLTHMSSTVSLKLIRYFLAVLMTAKHGLMQSEILDLLRKRIDDDSNGGEMNGLSGDPVLCVFLSRNLSFVLRTCYRKRHAFIQFGCHLFRKLCKNLVGHQALGSCLNDVLEYFQGDSGDPSTESVQYRTTNDIKTNHKHQRWRCLEEVTHLRIRLNMPVRRNFFDHRWIFDRVSLGDPYLLLEEIKMYKRRNPDDREFEVLRKILQLSAYALRHDGTQLFSQLYGRMRGYYVEPENSIKYPNVKNLYKTSATPPVPSFLSQGPCLRTLMDLQKPSVVPTMSSNESELFDDVMWLDTDGRYLVTYSGAKSEVTAWNVVQMKRMTSLGDMSSIDGMVSMHSNAEILLLHHSRLELYDLAKGILKVQMVELVDVHQGVEVLAGGKNVLAVSAGHDEILKFETYSGHVVSRIVTDGKRRLDRLLVSEKGELCVCGDSVQKPYPLLVWSLQSGQMLHHLSMPHHEYAVRHTRMSGDGGLLFAVAKDLLGSSPSFVIAYDLLTGSPVWEAQPESGIVSVDLCSATQSLVAATDTGFLHCWRLRDGQQNFKKSIPLHHKIDRLVATPEKSFLTWDSRSKNRCIRLWNTDNGTSLATFTADYDIVCCTLSRDGNSIGLVLSGKDIPAAIKLRTASLQISSPEDA